MFGDQCMWVPGTLGSNRKGKGWVPSRVSGQRGVGYSATYGAVPDVEAAKQDPGGMHTQMLSGGQTTVELCERNCPSGRTGTLHGQRQKVSSVDHRQVLHHRTDRAHGHFSHYPLSVIMG